MGKRKKEKEKSHYATLFSWVTGSSFRPLKETLIKLSKGVPKVLFTRVMDFASGPREKLLFAFSPSSFLAY
jgi:hypothetical protein